MSHQIYDADEHPYVVIFVNGYEVFGTTLNDVKPESREWFANHIDEGFQKAYERAAALAVRNHQYELRKLLGIKEPA